MHELHGRILGSLTVADLEAAPVGAWLRHPAPNPDGLHDVVKEGDGRWRDLEDESLVRANEIHREFQVGRILHIPGEPIPEAQPETPKVRTVGRFVVLPEVDGDDVAVPADAVKSVLGRRGQVMVMFEDLGAPDLRLATGITVDDVLRAIALALA